VRRATQEERDMWAKGYTKLARDARTAERAEEDAANRERQLQASKKAAAEARATMRRR
jgi:hypothetical protein